MPIVESAEARKSAWRVAKSAVRSYARDPSDASAGAVAAAFHAIKLLSEADSGSVWRRPPAPEEIPGLAEAPERGEPKLPNAA